MPVFDFRYVYGAGEMAQQIKMLSSLPEDPNVSPAFTLEGSQQPVIPAPGELTLLLASPARPPTCACAPPPPTHTQIKTTNKNFINFQF